MTRPLRTLFRLALLWLLPLGMMAQSTYFTHTIRKGETLFAISRIYNVGVQDIVALNPDAQKGIRTGDVLRIPQKPAATSEGKRYHTIAAGETLYRLTVHYGVSAADICAANPGLSSDNFKVGTVILIPPATEVITAPTPSPVEVKVADGRGLAGSDCREMYKVKRRDKVADVAKEFGVTVAELIAANPELKAPDYDLKKGTFLCIPFAKTPVKVETVTPTDAELFPPKTKRNRLNHIRVGVVLPFKEKSARAAKMVEFYQGLLLAVDSLKQRGINIDLYAVDSGTTPASLNQALTTPGLSGTDVIFGPLLGEHLATLADYCRGHKIKLVVPFAAQCPVLYNNPYVYNVNASKADLYNHMAELFLPKFANYNHVILNAEDGDAEARGFVSAVQETLASQGLTVQSVALEGDETMLATTLNRFRDNLIIPSSSSLKTLNMLLPKLENFVKTHPEYRITLLGYPDWQTYTANHLASFYAFDTYVFSPFYRNPLDRTHLGPFEAKYHGWFHRPMIQSYPCFGLLGFDVGYFFLSGLADFGDSFNENLPYVHMKPYQHTFSFERVSNWGGFMNRSVQLIHYTNAQQIEQIPLTK